MSGLNPGDPVPSLLLKDSSERTANVPVGLDDRWPRSFRIPPDYLGVVLSTAANEGVERSPSYFIKDRVERKIFRDKLKLCTSYED